MADINKLVDQLSELTTSIPEVDHVQVVTEQEDERSTAVETIQAVTLTITTVGGAVSAATTVLQQVKALIKAIHGVKEAAVRTANGVVPLEVSTRNEDSRE